jgi:hypothetical protein
MVVVANYLNSPLFWVELLDHLIQHVQSIDTHNMGLFNFEVVRQDIVAGVRQRQEQFKELLK